MRCVKVDFLVIRIGTDLLIFLFEFFLFVFILSFFLKKPEKSIYGYHGGKQKEHLIKVIVSILLSPGAERS